MNSLDHRIPPPLIALFCAVLAWAIARSTPAFALALPAQFAIAILFVMAGMSLAVAGMLAFRRAETTVDPRAPAQATTIVSSGPFRFTRNPMYLGMVLVLLGVCAQLENPLSVVAVVIFVAYITRFQIIPEERLLLAKFGEPFVRYMESVRRWI